MCVFQHPVVPVKCRVLRQVSVIRHNTFSGQTAGYT